MQRLIWPVASLVAMLSLALGPVEAAELTRPDVTFGGSTLPSSTPQFTRLPTFTVKPVITGYGTSGCIKIGGQITILGKYFGTPDGKAAVLAGHGLHVNLGIVAWGNTKIVATIPKDPQIESNQTYYIGIQKTGQTGWLSNIDKSFTTCATALSSRVQLSTAGTGFGPRVPAPSPSPSGTTSSAEESSGSPGLLSRALPAPPAVPESASGVPEQDPANVEPGELVVLSDNLAKAKAMAQQAGALGYSVKRRRILKGLGLVISVLRLPAGAPVMPALHTLRASAPKVWVDANHRYRLESGYPAKTYGRGLVGWGPPRASCGRGRRIGLIDTAVDLKQPALKGQAVTLHRMLPAGVPPAPPDHGTAIAALLVGRPRPAPTAGLVPGARLYVASVFRRRGDHIDTTAEDVVAALDWLVRQHVQVINLSLGGPRDLILEAAVQRTEDLGTAIVAAAGNGGPKAPPVYPAAQRGVVAVTAVDARLHPYDHANRGAYIALAAPGVDVYVARPGRGGVFVTGTSYAAPFVVAAIARQGGRPAAAVRALEKRARDLGKAGRDPIFGWGLVRASRRCGR